VKQAPQSITLFDREGKAHASLGGDHVHFTPGSSALNLLDAVTGKTRYATSKDFVDYVRLTDGLTNLAYISTAFSTNDIAVDVADAWRLFLCLTHSYKPVVSGAFTEHGVPLMANMMQLFRQNEADMATRPMAIFTVSPSGAFSYGETSCQNLLDCVTRGIPVEIVPVTLMGLTAPVTPVGATIFHVADVLAGLTMAQIIRPGASVLFGGAPAVFHMKEGTSPMSAVEAQRVCLMYIEVARALGIPCQAYMALSDSKTLDAQAGSETYGSALLAVTAGVNSVSGPGLLDYGRTFSPTKLVFDNEICGQALHFGRTVQPLEDIPILELTRRYLEEKSMLTSTHTQQYWRRELYLPTDVIDRSDSDSMYADGSRSLEQRAFAEINKILTAHEPVEMEPAIEAEMRKLILKATQNEILLPL